MFIPGGLLTGMGIGLAVDKVAAGMFLGSRSWIYYYQHFLAYLGKKGTANRDLEKRIEEIEKKLNSNQNALTSDVEVTPY